MALTDYQPITDGDTGVILGTNHASIDAVNVLTHDTRALSLDRLATGTGYAITSVLYYGADLAEFTTVRDMSIRALLCVGLNGLENHFGMSLRTNTTIQSPAAYNPFIPLNGFHLVLSEDGTEYHLKLYRSDTSTPSGQLLWSTTRPGTVNKWKWFHLRLDFLLRGDGGGILRVYENDIVANPIVPPNSVTSWLKISQDIPVVASDIPAYDRVGVAAQIGPGDPGDGPVYLDWLECWYGA